MNVRVFAAAALVASLAVVAVGASGASGGSAANTLTVWLQVDAQSGWPEVVAAANAQFKSQNPGWDVDVQYQTVGHPPREVRRDAGRQQRAGRHRDGEHRDDEVHGGGRVPGPDRRTRSRTRARGSRASRRPGGTAARSTAFRTTRARASSPTAPTCSSRSKAKIPTSLARVHALAQEARREEQGEGVLAGLHRGHRLVHRDELRLRLRRKDRHDAQGQVGRHARQAGRARRASPRTSGSSTPPRAPARRRTRRIRSRTTSMAQGNAASTYGAGLVHLLRR